MKIFNFIINNVEYTVIIENNIMKILNADVQICDNIAIADAYIDNTDIIKAIVESQIDISVKEHTADKLIADALAKLGINEES